MTCLQLIFYANNVPGLFGGTSVESKDVDLILAGTVFLLMEARTITPAVQDFGSC